MKLFHVADSEKAVITSFVGEYTKNPCIVDIKLVYEGEFRRTNEWDSIAIKWNPRITHEEIINALIKLRPKNYLGEFQGYHVFHWARRRREISDKWVPIKLLKE